MLVPLAHRLRFFLFFLLTRRLPRSPLFPYTTLFRSRKAEVVAAVRGGLLSLEEACSRYTLTVEEFLSWQYSIEREQRSEEHTSELQSRVDLVCRLLLEKKKKAVR